MKQGTDQKTIVDGAGLSDPAAALASSERIVDCLLGILYCADGIEPDLQEGLRIKLPHLLHASAAPRST